MKSNLSEEATEFVTTPRLIDATTPEVSGSFSYENELVSDEDQILFLSPRTISLRDHFKIESESGDYLAKTEKVWDEYKKTEQGKNEFAGPILSPTKIELRNSRISSVNFQLKLIDYKEFIANYKPDFTIQEKQRSYSLGITALIFTADDHFIFGIRNSEISNAGGLYEPIGGFINIDNLLADKDAEKFRQDMEDGAFRYNVNNQEYKNKIEYDSSKVFLPAGRQITDILNKDKLLTLGINEENIKNARYLAVTRKDLYLNYNIFVNLETNLQANQIGGSAPDKTIAVHISKLDEWILDNKKDITPTLKSILKCYVLA